jgi:transposase
MGRSRGGLTTKIHLLTEESGLPLCFRLTAGQRSDYTEALNLLGDRRADAVLADKGYDSRAIVARIEAMGGVAVIPSKRSRTIRRVYDREIYKLRNRIERCFNRLKQFRRFATRYCKSDKAFAAFVSTACAWLHLELYVDTP